MACPEFPAYNTQVTEEIASNMPENATQFWFWLGKVIALQDTLDACNAADMKEGNI